LNLLNLYEFDTFSQYEQMTSAAWKAWFETLLTHPERSSQELEKKWEESPPLVFRSWLLQHPKQVPIASKVLKSFARARLRGFPEKKSLFKKWKALVLDHTSVPQTLPPVAREEVLRELLRNRERITVEDYLEALGPNVSRRIAQLDLQKFPFLKKRGKTQSRFYVRSPAPRGIRRI